MLDVFTNPRPSTSHGIPKAKQFEIENKRRSLHSALEQREGRNLSELEQKIASLKQEEQQLIIIRQVDSELTKKMALEEQDQQHMIINYNLPPLETVILPSELTNLLLFHQLRSGYGCPNATQVNSTMSVSLTRASRGAEVITGAAD